MLAAVGATNVLLVTFLIPVSALLLGVGVLCEVIKVVEFAGMGCIFLGLIIIDGRVPGWLRRDNGPEGFACQTEIRSTDACQHSGQLSDYNYPVTEIYSGCQKKVPSLAFPAHTP